MWYEDFQTEKFTFAEREAFIVHPKGKPNGRMILRAEYLVVFPKFDIAMLERGYFVIFVSHRSRWAPDEEIHIMADFVRHCAEKLGTAERCILEGMSCGGLQAARFAEMYPELTAVLYLDAPVLNILSMVGLGECRHTSVPQYWREIVATYGVNRSNIVNFRKSAIDNMAPLIEHNIPLIMLYGNADDCVIYEENGKVLEEFYRANGGVIKVIAKSMCGHTPHGLDDPGLLIDFAEKHFLL